MKLACTTLLAMTAACSAIDYTSIIPRLEAVVQEEMQQWDLGGIAVALVDDQETVYANGFGEAKTDSIFRLGSISKLFNAVAVMQMVEAGKLDLDAPLPAEILPFNPFPGNPPVTLRQLLCHRSGLQREAKVGGYFDDTEPGLAATVGSLREGVLVTPPGEETRYSNVGASLAGHLVAEAAGGSFQAYQSTHFMEPLKMTDSAWTLEDAKRDRIVVSHMRVADEKGGWTRRDAPLFDLGTIPAGNLFSTAPDAARFASALLANDGRLVKPETLKEMWTPQLTADDAGFGLGFVVGRFRDHPSVGHNGAVFGHSCSLVLLPEAKVAVIVLGNEDIANGRINRISREALSLMLEAKLGEAPPAPAAVEAPADLQQFAGDYESESYWARFEVQDGQLTGNISGQPLQITAVGPLSFNSESRIDHAALIEFARNADGGGDSFTRGGQTFTRVPPDRPPLPPSWRRVLGSYGSDFIPVIISERHGHLYAMTENMVDYRLTPVNANVCKLCPGMYVDEEVVFLTSHDGEVHGINFANMIFPRNK